MRKPITELNYQELTELYKNNQFIRNTVFEFIQEERADYIDNEITGYFCNVWNESKQRREWYADIEEYYPGVFSVSVKQHNYKSFLECCRQFNNTGIGFNDPAGELKTLIDRLSTRADFFESCLPGWENISDKKFDLLEKWFDTGIEKICDELRKIIQSEYDLVFDDDYCISYFADCLADDAENMEADMETFLVYESIPARIVEHK